MTPKEKLISHLVELVQRPTAIFTVEKSRFTSGTVDHVVLGQGIVLEKPLGSGPDAPITVKAARRTMEIESRDLARYWNYGIEDTKARELKRAQEARDTRDNEKAQLILTALGI